MRPTLAVNGFPSNHFPAVEKPAMDAKNPRIKGGHRCNGFQESFENPICGLEKDIRS